MGDQVIGGTGGGSCPSCHQYGNACRCLEQPAPLKTHEEMDRWKTLPTWAQQELEAWRDVIREIMRQKSGCRGGERTPVRATPTRAARCAHERGLVVNDAARLRETREKTTTMGDETTELAKGEEA